MFDTKIPSRGLNIVFLSVCIFWSTLVAVLVTWNYSHIYSETMEVARSAALESYMKDINYRRWATMHGGVYVPITTTTPPNPYLADIPERDISTPSGTRLTLINPAYMTRQVHEIGEQADGIRGHITSLNPIKPENAPDNWEKNALQAFEKGQKEVYSVATIGDETYFRFMRPLVTESGCLKCHRAQGYKTGDIRGGISVSIKWSNLNEVIQAHHLGYIFGYGVIWIVGLAGIYLGKKRIQTHLRERMQAEETLKESENRYRFLAENMADVVWTLDQNLKTTYISPSVEKVFGFTPEERKQQTLEQMVTPASFQRIMARYLEELQHDGERDPDRSITIEVEYYHAAGHTIWVENQLKALRDQTGAVVGMYGSSRDIVERKRVEEELHQEYSFRSAIINNVAEGLCVYHETTEYPFIKFTVWNDRMTEITGYTMTEINRLGWYQSVYPDSELQARAIERRMKMRAGEDMHAEEWEIARVDGSKRVLSISTSVIQTETGIVNVLALMQDVTDRKKTEEALQKSEYRYRLLAENANDVLWTVDMNMRLTYVSPSVTRLLGFTEEEAMARTMDQAFTPAAFKEAIRIFDEEMTYEYSGCAEPNRSRMIELELFHKNGNVIPVEGNFGFLRDLEGHAVGMLAVIRDVSERKTAEQEKEKLIFELQEALSKVKK